MNSVHDSLVDATTRVLGFRTEAEASAGLPGVVKALERVRDRLRARKPSLRRDPDADAAADWMHRALHDAPIAEGDRAGALEALGDIKAMAGAMVVDWKPAEVPRRRGRPRSEIRRAQ